MRTKKIKVLGLSLVTALAINAMAAQEKSKDSQSLGSVDVISTETTLNQDTYTVESMNTSTKLDLSVRETPQSVTVMTSKELQDKGITSYQSLLAHVTGVSLIRSDERLKTSARGFDIDYFKIDGVPSYITYNSRDLELSMFDRVEIVRGANGLTTGAGNPGISINLVRKKAHSKELTGDVTAEIGSWNSYSVTTDIASALNETGTIRGRVVLKHEDADSFMDGYEKENNLIYGVVDSDITDRTRLSVGASYQKNDKSGVRWGGLPAFDSNNNRISFDRSLIVSEDWTYLNNEEKSFFADLNQILVDDIALNLSYTHNELTREDAFLYFSGKLNTSDGSGLSYTDWKSVKEDEQDNIDINIDIPFSLNNLDQQIIVGYSYNKDSVNKYTGAYSSAAVSNFYDYNIAEPADTDAVYEQPSDITQKAIYLSGKFSMTQDLKLIAGARLSSWKHQSEDSSVETRKFDNELTPYVGLVYDIDENHTVYTSYTSIFNPQDEKDKNGDYLNPIIGNSYEVGIKGEYFDGNLNTSLSLFRISQDKVAALDGKQIANPTADAYKEAKGVTSKGIEADITGNVTDRLSLSFGVAYFEAKDAEGAKFNTQSSRTTANVFTKYKLNEYTLGGGLQYKSKFYRGTGSSKITQDAYTLANVMFGYEINKQTNVQLNVSNLFDKKYYDGIGSNTMIYGEPRKAMISLKYTF